MTPAADAHTDEDRFLARVDRAMEDTYGTSRSQTLEIAPSSDRKDALLDGAELGGIAPERFATGFGSLLGLYPSPGEAEVNRFRIALNAFGSDTPRWTMDHKGAAYSTAGRDLIRMSVESDASGNAFFEVGRSTEEADMPPLADADPLGRRQVPEVEFQTMARGLDIGDALIRFRKAINGPAPRPAPAEPETPGAAPKA